MGRLLTFQELWDFTQAQNKHCNGVYYHPCCNIWTTRNSKTNRSSHKLHFNWKQIMASLPKDTEDKKQALQAKMIEEGWALPALLNKPCTNHSSPNPVLQPSSDSTSAKVPPQDLPSQPGVFTFSQLPGFTLCRTPLTSNLNSQGTSEQSKAMDTVSLQSFSLPGRSHSASEE